MEWLRELIVGGLITGLVASWLKGFLNQLIPSPARALLALRNSWSKPAPRAKEGFRLVLCWLWKDASGEDSERVAQAFVGVEGLTLVRSARIVSATGAHDEWRPAMKKRALRILEEWNGDLAIVGLVKKSGEVLALWFVPRVSEDTFARGDRPYTLENVTLGADFHHDLRTQLAAMALAALAPLADGERRGQVIERALRDATSKLVKLLEGRTFPAGKGRATLQLVLGIALSALGERESGTQRLEQSVDAYRAALDEFSRDRGPVLWALTVNSLGIALRVLGEREGGTERLEEAATAYRAVLEERTRERVPVACQGRRETRPKGGAKHCHRSRGGEVVRGGRDWAWGGGSRKRREGVARPEFPADDGVVISPRGPFSGRGCD